MTRPSDNKYADLEKAIDLILADGRIILFPPGSLVFILVNMLMLIGAASLGVVASQVLFAGQMEKGAVFAFVGVLILTILIVTPAFSVFLGFRRAVNYLRIIIIALLTLLVAFGVVDVINQGELILISIIGSVSMIISLLLVCSNSYQLFRVFVARRRELRLLDIEKKKHFL